MKGSHKWADVEERSESSSDTEVPTDSSDTLVDSSRNEEVSCPDCRSVMHWKPMKRGDCNNSKAVGSSCATPSSKGWVCDHCRSAYCIACFASLQKIEESQFEESQLEDAIEDDWQLVPSKQSKQRRPRNETKRPTGTNEQIDKSALVDAFCQRRELDSWVRRELLSIPAQEVGRVLATLSNAMEVDPTTDLRALIANKRTHCGLAQRRLDESISRELQEWISNLNMPDVDRNEFYATLTDGFEKSEIEYLMNQTNFARKVREGRYKTPVAVACSIMQKCRLNNYQNTVGSFSRWARLGRKAEEQLLNVAPKTGEAFMQKWKSSRTQDLEQIDREIQKMYWEELDGKQKKNFRPPVRVKLDSFRNAFAAYGDEDEGFDDNEVIQTEQPQEHGYQDEHSDDDEDEEVCLWRDESDEDDEFGPVALAPLPTNFAKRHAGEDISVTCSSIRSNGSLCRETEGEDRPGKRVPVETHFVVVVDVSGSMCEVDCKQPGGSISRIDAVFNEVRNLIDVDGARAGCDDRMSFITFSETAKIHFQEKPLQTAAKLLSSMERPKPQGRTFYAEGLRAAAHCAKKDSKHPQRPVDVVFLSDGEPSDSQDMLETVQMVLLPTRNRAKELAVHCIGFGAGAAAAARVRQAPRRHQEEDDVFTFLYQLSAVGEGHFHRASASTTSLRGAFRAVTSTISASRTVSLAKKEVDDGDQSPENGEKKKKKKKEHVEKPKTFELMNVIFDLDAEDLGKREIKANRILYEFDGSNFHSKSEETQVIIRRNPFTKGGMRHCYGLRDLCLKDKKHEKMVAKMSKWVEEGDVDPLTTVDVYAKQTAVAHYYARNFRVQCRKYAQLDVQLDFVPCYAYRPISADDDELHGFCGEQYVPGEFVKLTSNAGFVNREEYGAHANIGAAFSHFSFEWSKGALLVADIQGVCKGHRDDGRNGRQNPSEEDQNREWYLSDPQVLTDGASYDFGRGDLGLKGMQMFFKSHKCSWLCKKLGLKDIREHKEPTQRCFIPGSTNILAGLHGKEGCIVKEIRIKSGVSRLLLPREAYAEWIALHIYASSKSQANHAVKLVRDRVYELIDSYALVIPVPENSLCCSWNATYWRSKRVEWIEKSGGAQIVLYRGGWMQEAPREDGPVGMIYVFPKGVERGKGQVHADNRERDLARDLIVRDVLGEEPEARPAPLDRREMAKQIHEFVRQSGGRVTIANVGKQFANKIGTEKTQMEKNTFVQGLALEFRDLLDCNNQHIMMPAPKNAPVSAGPGPTQEAQTVRSLKDIEWLDGTTWKEVRYPAKYRISRIFNGKPGACFRVDKIIGSAHPYAITLYWDSKGKKLYYGDKYKWYLSMLTTDGRLNWSGKDDQVAYEWQIVGSAPKTPAEAAKQAAARPEEYPALPSAKAAPSSQAKREDSWSNSEPWGKQAAAKSEPHEADSGDSHDEVPPPPPEAPPAQGPVMKWFKYLAHDSDSAWWSCGYDERKWFYEGDQRWIKFQVPDGHPSGAGRTYFWNEDTQECFFEDTGDVIGGGA